MFLNPPGIQKKCNHCKKSLDINEFEKHLIKAVEVAYAKCITCRPKHAASAHTSANEAAVQKRFDQSTKGKARKKRFDQSAAGKARDKRFGQSAAGKATNKRSKQSAAGKAAKQRELETKKKRRACDPAFALQQALVVASSQLVSGDRIESPTFLERTSFDSEEQYRNLVQAAAERLGFTMSQYGDEWEVEHAIPQEAYDFSNPDDVKRCWSPANVRAMTPSDNHAKGFTILDELCMEVGSEHFPLSWNGLLQTQDEKEAFYIKCKTPWVPPEEEESDSDEESDEESGDEEDESEDDDADADGGASSSE